MKKWLTNDVGRHFYVNFSLFLCNLFIRKKKIMFKTNNFFFFIFQMAWGVSIVDTMLNKSFYILGKFIGRNPGYFIIIPVLLTIICITGWVFWQFSFFNFENIFLLFAQSKWDKKVFDVAHKPLLFLECIFFD